jgi:small GTP-binding protein
MGEALSSRYLLESDYFASKKAKVVLLGLDGSGKTQILYQLLKEKVVKSEGLHVETLIHRQIEFTVWDVGGEESIRKHWPHYVSGANAIIFVVSSDDFDRLHVARKELQTIIELKEMSSSLILVMANKMDLPNAMSLSDIIEGLYLNTVCTKHNWYIQPCSATQNEGLIDGIDWLASSLRELD